MKKFHPWITAIVAVTICCFLGCKKDKEPIRIVQTPPVPDQPVGPKYLAIKVSGADFTRIYKYDEDTDNLRSIQKFNAGSDTSYSVIYNDLNQPLSMNFVADGYILSHTIYMVDAEGRVTRGDVYNIWTDGWDWSPTTLKAYYTLTYNSSSQLTQVSYFHETGTKVSETFFDYNTEGNIRRVKSSGNVDLEYDSSNGIGKSLKYLHLFYVEGSNDLMFYNKNNLVKFNENTRSYKYNNDNYPVEMSINHAGSTSVYKIEYSLKNL